MDGSMARCFFIAMGTSSSAMAALEAVFIIEQLRKVLALHGANVAPAAWPTSMHSFMQRTATRRASFFSLTSPNTPPTTVPRPENVALMRSFDQRAPRRLSSIAHRAHFLEQRTNLRELCVRNALHAAHME